MMLRQAQSSEPRAFPRVAPARPRTVSRANPPFVRVSPPHARASARFHWEKPHQYGGTASSGSVVGNDPVDHSDFSGLAGCPSGMSQSDCGAALAAQKEGLQRISNTEAALKNLTSERDAVKSGKQDGLSAGAKATEGYLQKNFGSSGSATISECPIRN